MQPSGTSAFLLTLLLLAAPAPAAFWLADRGGRAWHDRSPSLALVAALTAWCAIQTAIGIALGMAGLFARGPLAVAEAALFGAGLAALRWCRRACGPTGGDSGALPAPLASPRPYRLGSLGAWEWALAGALLATAIAHYAALAARPTSDWDSVAFHLPPMFHWVQTGRLGVIPDIRLGFVYRYPYGGELLGALFVLAYRSDFLAALPNLVSWVLLGAGVHASARLLGARRPAALAAAALLLNFIFVARHIATLHVDVPMAGHFAAALALGLAWVRRPSAGAAAAPALAVGLLLGTRLSAPAYILTLFGVAAVLLATRALAPDGRVTAAPSAGRAPSRRAAWTLLGGATLVALFAGGYWYARNWADVGTPFGLIRMRFAGFDLMPSNVDPRLVVDPALYRASTIAYLFRPTSREDWAIVGIMLRTELGWPFVVLALTAAAGSAILLTRHGARQAVRVATLLALFAATFYFYAIVPTSGAHGPNDRIIPWCAQAIRYSLSALAVLAVLGAAGASVARVPPGVCCALGCAACAWGATQMAWPGRRWAWLAAAGIAGAAVLTALLARSGRRLREWPGWIRAPRWGLALAGAAAVLAAFAVSIHYLHREHEMQRGVVYGGLTQYVDSQIAPDDPIGLLTAITAPLYGSHLTHRVAPAFSIDESPSAWVERLRREGIRHLALGPIEPATMQFDSWSGKVRLVTAPGGPFAPEFGRDPMTETVLYRLR